MKSICKFIKKHKEDKERYEAKFRELLHELEVTRAFLINITNESAMDENTLAAIKCKISELTTALYKGEDQL